MLHANRRGFVMGLMATASITAVKAQTPTQATTLSLPLLPAGAAQIKVWHADQLIDIAPQAHTVTASPGKLTLQLSVVPRRRRI